MVQASVPSEDRTAATSDVVRIVRPDAEAGQEPHYAPSILAGGPTNDATMASIHGYIAAGEHLRVVADSVFKVCIGLLVLVLAAWVLGWLPAAVPVF